MRCGGLISSGRERHGNYGKCNKMSREKQSCECRKPKFLLWNLSSVPSSLRDLAMLQ